MTFCKKKSHIFKETYHVDVINSIFFYIKPVLSHLQNLIANDNLSEHNRIPKDFLYDSVTRESEH